ncbi:hypothetical protein CKAN_01823900 [Cinnamomum micranthum f. kanehirae]|uniref:Uncharacterized protein n=1 Tax=Cinnamomum micranthum f. kanehirae TaxID=337451 RepID=A0A443PEK0_9MAGN|nr:hypothetical protein CKAN_01823900 [Cinnamomum micranthum f. kanehirae]
MEILIRRTLASHRLSQLLLKHQNPSPLSTLVNSRVFSSNATAPEIDYSISDEIPNLKKSPSCEVERLARNHTSITNSKSLKTPKEDPDPSVIASKLGRLVSLFQNHASNTNSKHLETPKEDPEPPVAVSKLGRLVSLFEKPSNPPSKSDFSKKKKKQQKKKEGNEGSAESVVALAEVEFSSTKQLSPDMILFVNHLFEKGYLSKANFLQEGRLDVDSLSSSYAQGFLKNAAERFGRNHQHIAKWLSGSDLKKVTLLGCPSVEQKTVLAAKNLRTFFNIEEDTVCKPCVLKSSCKFMKQRVDKKEKLDLADALRVLTVHASNSGPQQLALSNEMMESVNKLLKEVVNLSK